MNILLANDLPCHLMPLNHWQLIKVTGHDTRHYLQGQLTINIDQLTDVQALFSAHCDPKGKTLSNMLIFQQNEAIYYLVRHSTAELQLADLKKYAVFSKVEISLDNSQQLLGIAGKDITSKLQQLNITVPTEHNAVSHQNEITIICLTKPEIRYIVIANQQKIAEITDQLQSIGCQETDDNQWLSLDIEAGYPIIDEANFNQFLPQAMSLEKIDAISFDKGCYRGQEMVARAQFRGANKRALFQLIGESEQLPIIGDGVEILLGENKRDTGHVLAAVRLADNRILVQAILNNDANTTTVFSVKNSPESELHIRG